MTEELTPDDFPGFFLEVHGYPPFPWQTRLLRHIVEEQQWPASLDLPTGFGKTATLDVAVFHLALEAAKGSVRRAPIRMVFVVDRRLVVDDAFRRAQRICKTLASAEPGPVTRRAAERLRLLAADRATPLLARQLRGGMPLESDWARSVSQRTVLCSTVDQAGSRLLFRGYGVSNSMKPVHAGLLGADCLLLLDEAHLSEPFRQTLGWVERYKARGWRESDSGAPWEFATLTATPGNDDQKPFSWQPEDLQNDLLRRRWQAAKPADLIELSKSSARKEGGQAIETEEEESGKENEKARATHISNQAEKALERLQSDGIAHPTIALVLNRILRARSVFEEIGKRVAFAGADRLLMIGAARPVDRDDLAKQLEPIRTGDKRRCQHRPLIIVSTQCIEAGVDIDLDGLITEAAPLDALRQRFGRLNRDGRPITPYAAIIGGKSDKEDPVYGAATLATWQYLRAHADSAEVRKPPSPAQVDFGLKSFQSRLDTDRETLRALYSPKANAPVLMPAHLDLLSQTSPVPYSDPEVALYLHGPKRSADTVTVIWRADLIPGAGAAQVCQLLLLMRPRSLEAIELPVWAVQAWLRGKGASLRALADVPSERREEEQPVTRSGNEVFHWTGEGDDSQWIGAADIKPGYTVIAPAFYGGVDQFGWNPKEQGREMGTLASDVADKAAARYARRYLAVRVAPAWFKSDAARAKVTETVRNIGTSQTRWRDLRDALQRMVHLELADLEALFGNTQDESAKVTIDGRRKMLDDIAGALGDLDGALYKGVRIETAPYEDEQGNPRGVIFIAPYGVTTNTAQESEAQDGPNTTEDDLLGSHWNASSALPLEDHCKQVEAKTREFAERAGLPTERIGDLADAAYLHDAGKVDVRFQRWLHYSDPIGPDPDDPDNVLAKSALPLPPAARAKSGLPERWRHEALSVRLAQHAARFHEASDKDLVLWLIGVHHGYGRPLFHHHDPEDAELRKELPELLGLARELPPGAGPQSLAFDWDGADWPSLYERLKIRYGVWELARMEACLRLADHVASDEAERERAEKG